MDSRPDISQFGQQKSDEELKDDCSSTSECTKDNLPKVRMHLHQALDLPTIPHSCDIGANE